MAHALVAFNADIHHERIFQSIALMNHSICWANEMEWMELPILHVEVLRKYKKTYTRTAANTTR